MERRVPGRPPEIKILIKTEKNWKKSDTKLSIVTLISFEPILCTIL